MYVNEIKRLAERLVGFSKLMPKDGSWAEHVRRTIKELREALDLLEKEIDDRTDRAIEKQGITNVWDKEHRADSYFNMCD